MQKTSLSLSISYSLPHQVHRMHGFSESDKRVYMIVRRKPFEIVLKPGISSQHREAISSKTSVRERHPRRVVVNANAADPW